MNKKHLLGAALLGALGLSQTAMAQNYDDRWYVSGTLGMLNTDNDRGMGNTMPTYGVGVGKFVAPRFSVDLEADRMSFNRSFLDWDLTGLALIGRYHFIQEGRNWWPYLAAGIGAQYHNQEFVGMLKSRQGTDLMAKLGGGLEADLGRVDIRVEAGMRFDRDDGYNYGGPPGIPSGVGESGYRDFYANLSVLVALGAEPRDPVTPAEPMPAPVAPSNCANLDDDGDGINNCNDQCAGSTSGQAIGPNGCPVPLTIDLRGVNFDFDRDTLRPDAVVILDEAIAILQKYPQMRFEVAGHTDAVGTETYNEALSQRRARVVFDYLGNHGIDTGRMVGPTGYGENRPIAPNANADGSDDPDGRARNRRTELNVQN